MVKSLNNALVVAAAAVSSAAASGSGSGSGSDAMVFAVNVTFCDHQQKMAICPDTLAETFETGTYCFQPEVGSSNCVGDWPDRKDEPYTAADQTRKGPSYGKDNKDGGPSPPDWDPRPTVAFYPFTTMSHSVKSVGDSMTVTSGSCFIWNSFQDPIFQGKDIGTWPLSARAWCGGNGDKPTVQFYKGGNCAEDTELGGKNNKDDKGLLFDTPDTCGTKAVFLRQGAVHTVPKRHMYRKIIAPQARRTSKTKKIRYPLFAIRHDVGPLLAALL